MFDEKQASQIEEVSSGMATPPEHHKPAHRDAEIVVDIESEAITLDHSPDLRLAKNGHVRSLCLIVTPLTHCRRS